MKVTSIVVLMLMLSFVSKVFAAKFDNLIIYTESDPPYVTVDEKRKVGGLTSARLDKLLKAMNYSKEKIKVEPWARSYQEAMSTPNVMIYAIVKTPERIEKLEYIYKLYNVSVHLFKLKSNKEIKVSKIDDAKKYSVCVVRHDYRAEYLKTLGFPKLDESTDSTQNVKKFMEGRCELAILSETGLSNKLTQLKSDSSLDPKKFDKSLVKSAYNLKELDSDLYIAINKNTDAKIISELKNIAKKIN